MNTQYRIQQFFSIFEKMNYQIDSDKAILDFGCGDGELVNFLRGKNYNAYGCDIGFKENTFTKGLVDNEFIRLIDFDNYKIPFDEDTFDFVISDQVFEHVQNYDESLAEIRRVLKPGGACLHLFPSRYSFIEPHVKVPFATINKSYYWLKFWALMGIRKKSQDGWDASRVADDNYFYLNNRTTYLNKTDIKKFFQNHFEEVSFCEDYFLRSTEFFESKKWVRPILKNKFTSNLYSSIKGRVVLAKKM